MKNKHKIILGFLVIFFAILPTLVGAVGIDYKPNVPLPVEIGRYDFSIENKDVGPDFLASYIVAIYEYGAGFAGIVAMFMLVIAGWRWLMAAGNASKISEAKDMISGVLMGLALLFGGQLLLRQISTDFDSIQSLEIDKPPLSEIAKACIGKDANGESNDFENREIQNCSDYQTADACVENSCDLEKINNADQKCGWVGLNDGSCNVCPAVTEDCELSWYENAVISTQRNPCGCE